MPNKNSRSDSGNKAFLSGVQFMMDNMAFGTGISDSFPDTNEEMNLENLNKIKIQFENYWNLENLKKEEYQDIELYKQELIECELESTEDNLILFIQGILHWTQSQLLNEYMEYKFDD